jgi:hypothetical protein
MLNREGVCIGSIYGREGSRNNMRRTRELALSIQDLTCVARHVAILLFFGFSESDE